MSRVGKKPISIPNSVKIKIDTNKIFVEGPKGKLDFVFPEVLEIKVEDSILSISNKSSFKKDGALYGLTRSIVNNMVVGVTDGFSKELEIRGVGFRVQVQGKKLSLALGFSHPIDYDIPEGITIETPKPTNVIVKGIDKMMVGKVASKIRSFYRPEPYKGKGIRYVDENVRKKAGKTVA